MCGSRLVTHPILSGSFDNPNGTSGLMQSRWGEKHPLRRVLLLGTVVLTMPSPLCVNASHVVHETIDGETILIHLGTGTYYSLDGIGTEVWVLLAAGASREALLAAANDRYAGDPVEIETGISSLLADLLHQGLLVEGEPGTGPDSPTSLPPGRAPFVTPALHVYTDMQEFMLVDPLHDVDEVAGWPHAKTD